MALSIPTAVLLTLAGISSAKSLWSTTPANFSAIIRTAYPVGNGRLAALPFGEPGHEKLSLDRDELWSGGPFENSSYRGGNPPEPVYQYLPGIRDWIWQNGTGNVTALMHSGDDQNYGSYAVLGNLSVTISGIRNATNYKRALDLDTGVHTTTFSSGGSKFTINTYCTYPDDVCVYDVQSSSALPSITVGLENVQSNASLVAASCSAGQANLHGITTANIGMTYKASAKVVGIQAHSYCANGTLTVPSAGHKDLTLVLAAGTNYDETHGTAAYNFSFRGADPGPYVQYTVNAAAAKSASHLLDAHLEDYTALAGAFTLDIADTRGSAGIETADLIARYTANDTSGDPFLESLSFDLGRHLFITATRNNSLPPNLQGKWAYGLGNAWGADYHANINLQMNHWPADQTGLGQLQGALWDYMADTWAPRGAETAKLIYDAPGWVVHDEVNIFGHTGMKTGDAEWANYPASAAWMMQHVWDYYDYSQDLQFLAEIGYPKLLKPIAEFWVSQLQQDDYFRDGTLVVNPCSSPEHGPVTFGCAHWQQLIYQVFETTLQSADLVGASDHSLLASLRKQLAILDKGLRIGSWGQVQEWKVDIDTRNDTHRHLSHLVGWYPGWSLSSYLDGYSNSTIQGAVMTTLWSRGIGIGSDANAGWEKVWRSACWARLNETERAYYEVRLTIQENWAPNAFSMYSGKSEPFQIDANYGFPGAVLSMLVVDMPRLPGSQGVRTVVLGPAIPAAWANGTVKGLRLRGGGCVDFSWDAEGLVTKATLSGGTSIRLVNKSGEVLAQSGAVGYHE